MFNHPNSEIILSNGIRCFVRTNDKGTALVFRTPKSHYVSVVADDALKFLGWFIQAAGYCERLSQVKCGGEDNV